MGSWCTEEGEACEAILVTAGAAGRHLAWLAFSWIGCPYKIDFCFAPDQPLRLAFYACFWSTVGPLSAFVAQFSTISGHERKRHSVETG